MRVFQRCFVVPSDAEWARWSLRTSGGQPVIGALKYRQTGDYKTVDVVGKQRPALVTMMAEKEGSRRSAKLGCEVRS